MTASLLEKNISFFSEQEREIDRIDLPSWLSTQECFPKLYWKCRKTGVETVALGSLIHFSEIPILPKNAPDSFKLYGALSFTSEKRDPCWKDFPSPFFFLPKIEISQSPSKTILKIRGPNQTFQQPGTLDSTPLLGFQTDTPSKKKWTQSIEEILRAIEQKEIQKVVLARKSSFKTQANPFSWLQKLIHSSLNSTIFAFQMKPSSLFLGATPEMLYQRKGNFLFTESLAGTRKRGTSLIEDLKLANELKTSLKENQEFLLVKDFLCNALTSLCEEFSHEALDSLLQTSKVQHLYNRFQGLLKPGVTDFDIISLLHPTPAIGGLPRDKAFKTILALEEFDRGLYAGALGWISREESSFAVTIRSALIEPGLLHAFAGTGIVDGSNPEKEWVELDDKISHWRV